MSLFWITPQDQRPSLTFLSLRCYPLCAGGLDSSCAKGCRNESFETLRAALLLVSRSSSVGEAPFGVFSRILSDFNDKSEGFLVDANGICTFRNSCRQALPLHPLISSSLAIIITKACYQVRAEISRSPPIEARNLRISFINKIEAHFLHPSRATLFQKVPPPT